MNPEFNPARKIHHSSPGGKRFLGYAHTWPFHHAQFNTDRPASDNAINGLTSGSSRQVLIFQCAAALALARYDLEINPLRRAVLKVNRQIYI
jgi:hypothetical protein